MARCSFLTEREIQLMIFIGSVTYLWPGGLADVRPEQHDVRSEAGAALHLGEGCQGRHDDRHWDPELLSVPGQREGVVAR